MRRSFDVRKLAHCSQQILRYYIIFKWRDRRLFVYTQCIFCIVEFFHHLFRLKLSVIENSNSSNSKNLQTLWRMNWMSFPHQLISKMTDSSRKLRFRRGKLCQKNTNQNCKQIEMKTGGVAWKLLDAAMLKVKIKKTRLSIWRTKGKERR